MLRLTQQPQQLDQHTFLHAATGGPWRETPP
jgi:hypothetical protein